MRFILSLLVFALAILPAAVALEDKDFGITRQTHGSSAFVFRNGKLVHEITKLSENWVEIFYDGSQRIFSRGGYFKDGAPITTSEWFAGTGKVQLLSMPGDLHPRRIHVGSEIYNRSADGFFEIMRDPLDTLTESTLMGAQFSTVELDKLRETLLKKPSEKKE